MAVASTLGPLPLAFGIARENSTRASASCRRQRATGHLAVSLEVFGGRTQISDLMEAGPLRLRVPRTPGPGLEALILNNAGGVACGDRLTTSIEAGPGAQSTFTTASAEKIYRSDGPLAHIGVRIRIAAGARLAWLPQETILFDRMRLSRRFDIDIAADASLVALEALVLGRTAHGEEVREGSMRDIWRIRRAGRLIYADTLALDGPIAALMARPGIGGGARALATLLHVAPDAESRLDEARALLAASPCAAAASAWNGLLAIRFMASTIGDLRKGAMAFLLGFRHEALPRVWSL